MKPHRLRFAGIGAYPNAVEVNFDDLGELGLYLVVGPTGSGKTTIFDAITFALYGELAGARSKATFVSDHAHRSAPFVELDFSHRGVHFRLHRKPPVNGKQVRPTDVWLGEFTDGQYDDPAVSRVTGMTNVNDRVATLIGLDADQFMRVMLLPQNEFQQFLLANSTKKEELLRALFGTGLYESVAIQLANSARQLRIAAERAADEITEVQASIRGQVDTVLTEGLGDSLPDPVDDLAGVITELRALHTAATTEAAAATERVAAATAARATAVSEAKRFDAGCELAELETVDVHLAPQVADAEQQLEANARAQRVQSAVAARDAASNALDHATQRVADNRAELIAALDAAPADVPVLAGLRAVSAIAAPATLAAELATATANVDRALEAFRQAALHATAAADHDAKAEADDATAAIAADAITSLTATIDDSTTRLGSARALADSFPDLDRELAALVEHLSRADVATAAAELVAAQTALDLAQESLGTATDELAAARRARTMQLAGELAAQLAEGEACPVCGSTDHPEKAAITDGADVAALETARDRAATRCSGAETAYNLAHERMVAADTAAAGLPPAAEQLELRERHAAADGARAICAELESTLTAARADLTRVTAEHTAATSAVAQRRADADRLRGEGAARRAEAEAVIAENVVEVVAQALTDANHFIDGLGTAVADLESTTGARRTTEQQVTASLHTEGFTDEVSAAAALLTSEQRAVFDGLVGEAATRATRIVECRAVVGDAPLPAERPDLDGLTAAERDAIAVSRRATSHVTTLANAATSIEQSATQLAALAPDVERQRARAERASRLADLMKNGSKDTLGLERWVQRTVFEEVCDVASVQLLTLSAGRYVLTLEGARRASAGLDLFVTDSHTGATRSVGTLSGGEQFLTSLALALALAEVVQRRSGGIELATLFIDEGFGSLDGQTLDTAVEVLRSLHDTGRTVGVISHVEAMQQELRTGIRVTPGPTGSTLAVHPELD